MADRTKIKSEKCEMVGTARHNKWMFADVGNK